MEPGYRDRLGAARLLRRIPLDREARAVPAPDPAAGVAGQRVVQFLAEARFAAPVLEKMAVAVERLGAAANADALQEFLVEPLGELAGLLPAAVPFERWEYGLPTRVSIEGEDRGPVPGSISYAT